VQFGCKTFLRSHTDAIASMDMFIVPTISFRLLYGILIVRLSRRKLLWLGVTAHPNAEWIARQLTEEWLSLANGIFGTCSIRIKTTTTRFARTYRCRKMRRPRDTPTELAALSQCQFWVDFITNIFEFEFPTGTAASAASSLPR
jgi:hypothetical protein